METFPLSLLARELIAMTRDLVPGHRKLHRLVLDGYLPAEMVNGRWFIRRTDLPTIAGLLRLSIKTENAE